jgi:hypothetical protein
MLGEATEEEMKLFEEHLLHCSSCRLELKEMEVAWNMIPFKLDDVEVPSDLKEEVMNFIFQADNSPNHKDHLEKAIETKSKTVWPFRKFQYVLAAAVLLLSFGGVIWNNLQLRKELKQVKENTLSPTDVVQVYSLKSADPKVNSAKGNAWVYKNGNRKEIVFKLRGLASTKGSEAYQVWLIHDGQRRSAGTFHADKNGNGFLSYEFNVNEQVFEAIGISLEPNGNGTQPRGKKVLGT